MSAATGRSLRTGLRQLTASKMVIVQIVLGTLTIVLSWISGWQAAVIGLVLMNILTALAALGPWGGRPTPRPTPGPPPASKSQLTKLDQRVDKIDARLASKTQMTRLEHRVDSLGARLVASTERTRVEVLDALAQSRIEAGERQS